MELRSQVFVAEDVEVHAVVCPDVRNDGRQMIPRLVNEMNDASDAGFAHDAGLLAVRIVVFFLLLLTPDDLRARGRVVPVQD